MADRLERQAKRFWQKVRKLPSGCWEWQGAGDGHGYGAAWYDGKVQKAHRVAWAITRGEVVPSKMDLCHSCDNRACVNPDHLFVGTRLDNMRDAVSKNRKIGRPSRLARSQVEAIRNSSESVKLLAQLHGVSPAMVSMIRNNKTRVFRDA